MRLFLSIFTAIITIAFTAIYQQEHILQYMRGLLRPSTINNISKNLTRANGTQSLFPMAPASTFVGLPVIPPNDASLKAASPKPRGIQKVFEAREQPEGAGATVRRSVGTPRLRHLTPFLMMDHASVGPGAGFTDHPHRGK
jgi:hypothetical protein